MFVPAAKGRGGARSRRAGLTLSASIAAIAAAGGLSAAVTWLMLRHAARLPADRPNERSLHVRATPRGGGLAIWAGFLPVALALPPAIAGWGWWLAALVAVALVSFADDLRGVAFGARLAVHVAAGALVAATLVPPAGAPLAFACAVLAVVWGANLFNFMDGSDGLAGLMALAGFGALAVAASVAGVGALAATCVAVAAASVPFLLANLPPARLFMGDVGSVPLGFLAAALGIAGTVQGAWPAWFPALVFLPFLADATATLLRRALRGEAVWRAHRSHFYQRLHASGAGHRGTLAVWGVAMAACAAVAVACLVFAPARGAAALAAMVALHLIGFAAIDYHARKSSARPP
jgi:UDP-N-acetylmuramyl pentapeptide phosphotransferase/UDP-N-acetylglucosamine-1-phosphate transferase